MAFTPRARTRTCLPPRPAPDDTPAPARKPSGCPLPTVTAPHRPGRSAWTAAAQPFALAAITGAADALTTVLLHLVHLAPL
ncbi:hypothetical protein [Streptomyces galbus]|uniref:hypothetical protein n=1 Tax=Streptomyces galbus TaxID=33898 RepID=UPI00144A5275|nr:hypothetical protein [Streptomyces galbus]GHD32915.1 hypothetical protein GCM10010335_25380 [Streptomyces galbus]